MASTPQTNGVPPTSTPTYASPISAPQPAPQPQSANQLQVLSQQLQASQSQSQASAPAPGTAPNTADTPTSSTRPHDARTIHLILNSLGLSSYQERVPLQLLDLAYRYSSSILSDAAHLAAEGYTMPDSTVASASNAASNAGGGGGGRNKKASNDGDVTLPALRLATSARLGHGFHKDLPKIALLGLAEERNRVRLPEVGAAKVFGCRLPEERFLLTGRAWGLGYEEEVEGGEGVNGTNGINGANGEGEGGAALRGGVDGAEGRGEDEEMDEDGEGGFEDVFGEDGGGDEMEE